MSVNLLTIVVYHFVRPLGESQFPKLVSLDLQRFEDQLAYLANFYEVVHPNEVMRSIQEGTPLPGNAALLTFDDGYKDHLSHVFPRLKRYGWSALFFPPSAPILNRELLDVNRIHFVLASLADKTALVNLIERHILDATSEFALNPISSYRAELRTPSRFDEADVAYCKRLLQHALPEPLRLRIARELFSEFVSTDEKDFANELYLSLEDLRVLREGGMEVGSHGHHHYWLGKTESEKQKTDIDQSLKLLQTIGVSTKNFWFCYPYGSYNEATLQLLKERSCGAAVTTVTNLANLKDSNPLLLPRLDTNDLPQVKESEANHWTHQIAGVQNGISDSPD